MRNYVRISGADHLQAVAHAQFAKALGAQRVAVLSPRGDEPYGPFAEHVGTSGRKLGLDVVTVRYDREALDFTPFARTVARKRPDVVAVADLLDSEGRSAALIRAVRAAVGPKVEILLPDGFEPLDDLVALAGPRRDGALRQPVRRPQCGATSTRTGVPREFREIEALGRRAGLRRRVRRTGRRDPSRRDRAVGRDARLGHT